MNISIFLGIADLRGVLIFPQNFCISQSFHVGYVLLVIMKEPQKHLHAKGCASLVIRLVSSCGEEGSLPDAHSAMRGGADLRFIATKCPTVLCLALKVPVLHFFAMYAWWAQNSSSISSFVGCQQGLISLVIPQSLLIKMLHLQLSIIWKLSSLLRNSKHIKLEGKHRPPSLSQLLWGDVGLTSRSRSVTKEFEHFWVDGANVSFQNTMASSWFLYILNWKRNYQ